MFNTEMLEMMGGNKAPSLPLLLASALVERVVEVFLSIWKRSQVDGLEQELEFWQAIQGSRHNWKNCLRPATLKFTARPAETKSCVETKRLLS